MAAEMRALEDQVARELKPRKSRIKKKKPPESSSPTSPNIASFFWANMWERIRDGKITPIVGDAISTKHIFGTGYEDVVEKWAQRIEYPWKVRRPLSRVAQYLRIREDVASARSDYLMFLKEKLLYKAYNDDEIGEPQYEEAYENRDDLFFSDMAEILGYLKFDKMPNHPLTVLANLPLPIYVTSSYHRFLEVALKQTGKKPQSEVYRWNDDLKSSIGSIFDEKPNFTPTENEPLVYHLHGRDDFPASLVLTENCFLDFLVKVSQDLISTPRVPGRKHDFPSVVENTLTQSSLLLVGYELGAWDFLVLFHGMVQTRNDTRQQEGICIQVDNVASAEMQKSIQEHLQNYFLKESKLKIYWGDPQECMQEIQAIWNKDSQVK